MTLIALCITIAFALAILWLTVSTLEDPRK